MGYSRQVYIEAENELNRRHSEAVSRAQRRLDAFYAACPEAEITLLEGGQPVYHYLISVE